MDFLVSILTGGATGLLGTILSFGTAYFKEKQKHAQEIELRRLDMEQARAEAEAASVRAKIEAEAATEQAELGALAASYKEAATRWSDGDSRWLVAVDVIRGLIRPVLTLIFVALTGAVYFTTQDAALRVRAVETVLYLATTCVLWWFGARQIAKKA